MPKTHRRLEQDPTLQIHNTHYPVPVSNEEHKCPTVSLGTAKRSETFEAAQSRKTQQICRHLAWRLEQVGIPNHKQTVGGGAGRTCERVVKHTFQEIRCHWHDIMDNNNWHSTVECHIRVKFWILPCVNENTHILPTGLRHGTSLYRDYTSTSQFLPWLPSLVSIPW